MVRFFDGRAVLYRLIEEILDQSSDTKQDIYIALHRDNSNYYKAAEVSAREKGQAFGYLGFNVHFVASDQMLNRDYQRAFVQLERPPLVIFQRPFPETVVEAFKRAVPVLDLDTISTDQIFQGASAVTEAVTRLLRALTQIDPLVVVVGGRGRFGSQIVHTAQNMGLRTESVDIGDDREIIQRAAIVVSAVGKPGIITPGDLGPGLRFLIDVGFNVIEGTPRQYCGDIDPRCYRLARLVTPVPGGVGPLQVATLIERATWAATQREIPRWDISKMLLPLYSRGEV
ncbi:hypothetical protein [Rhizobium leguminosarum]|uniref:hypothetical protein n=1 Tax=Rhizobium leguminosarum TaxID=384 RepID=UPI001615F5E4|nr:hypothetical protein [Rhizobium leguminosarum]MBB4342984.1 methylenetetrahydrofolate dehydrogenase (NADP+)/methenyltetrahydrofolate cyclohydrolase [Rhizobium leguminosarum]MBB6296062.1 methylenetetrahydrofolate dehydrogenase (NADP+)/methenyltetrahydrofolate cyclohydrolase [Rhizobium leguminosarum]